MVIADLAPKHLDDVCSLEHCVNRCLCLSRKQTRAALLRTVRPIIIDGRPGYFGGLVAHPSNPATLQPLGPADAYAFWMIQGPVLHLHRVTITDRATATHFDAKFMELLQVQSAHKLAITCWTTAEQSARIRPYTPPHDLLEGLGFAPVCTVDQAFETQPGTLWWNPNDSGLTTKDCRQFMVLHKSN